MGWLRASFSGLRSFAEPRCGFNLRVCLLSTALVGRANAQVSASWLSLSSQSVTSRWATQTPVLPIEQLRLVVPPTRWAIDEQAPSLTALDAEDTRGCTVLLHAH